MLGIPADRHDDARQWTDDLLTREPGNPVPPPAAAEGAMQIAVLAHQLAAPAASVRPTTSSARWCEAEIDGEPLTDEQVIGFCLLLITGGHETTSKLIANGDPPLRDAPRSARRAAIGRSRAHDRRGRGAAALHQPDAVHGAHHRPARSSCTAWRCPQGPRWCCCSDRATATRASSTGPTSSTSRAPTRASSRSVTARTCASARRSPGSRRGSHCRSSSPGTRAYTVDEDAVEFLHSGNVQGPDQRPGGRADVP